jgi:hypothetical protein
MSEKFRPGNIVWAKISGYPWWPARVSHRIKKEGEEEEQFHVVFFGDTT